MPGMIEFGQHRREPCQKKQKMYFYIDYGRDSIETHAAQEKIAVSTPSYLVDMV